MRGRPSSRTLLLVLAAGGLAGRGARGDGGLTAAEILGRPGPAYKLESVRMRFTHMDQTGQGYQSQAGPRLGPGSEAVLIEQPQVEIVAHQGEKLTHRIWVPLDVITAASADALDAITTASRVNEAVSIDLSSTYHADRRTDLALRAAFHVEETVRSWAFGASGSRTFADDNATVQASIQQIFDWFDDYDGMGFRHGNVRRSTSNANLGFTQLLSPTTVAHLNYGFTLQLGSLRDPMTLRESGTLNNRWNTVPLEDGTRGPEIVPTLRQRHAFVGRLAQYLPWRGALRGFYRFYIDDWGVRAHTFEAELLQRFSSFAHVKVGYRLYWQNGVDFFFTRAPLAAPLRVADSDLARFLAHSLTVKIQFDVPFTHRRVRALHADVGFERYWRSNDLQATILTCGLGLGF